MSLEGKADSKVTTAVVAAKALRRVGTEPGEKDVVEIELNFSDEFSNYAESDKIIITVRDRDLVGMDTLGKAVVADAKFGGCVELEGVDDGHKAFIVVQLGDGDGTECAAAEFKKGLSDAIVSEKGLSVESDERMNSKSPDTHASSG